jgi:hypothetical protein
VIITSATVGILVYAIPEQLKDFPYRDREGRVRSEINKWLSKDNGHHGEDSIKS